MAIAATSLIALRCVFASDGPRGSHLTSYDLVILAPAFILIGDWIISNPAAPKLINFQWLLYLSFALPLFGPAIRDLRVQAAVPVFFLLFVALASRSTLTISAASAPAVD